MANIKDIKVRVTLDNREFTRNIKKAESDVKSFGESGKTSVNQLEGAFRTLVGAIAVGELVNFANQAQNLQNRLRGVTASTAEATAAFNLVRDVAASTRSDIASVADLFSNLMVATADMGKSQEDVARISETFSKALKVSGADANASAGAIRQFGQALASGVLRGDEFNSIMEANPVFMRAVAEQLGVTIGEMRGLAEEGALTADVIVAATEDMTSAIDENFGNTVMTIGEAFTMISNEFVTLLTTLEQKTGVFSGLAGLIKLAADNVEFLAKMLAAAFAASVAVAIVNVTTAVLNFAKALQAAYVAGTLLQGVTGVGLAKVGVGITAATAAIVGMNALFDDTVEGIEAISQAGEELNLNLPTAPSQTPTAPGAPTAGGTQAGETRAAALLRLSRERVQADKDSEAALKDAERAAESLGRQIANNLQTARDNFAENKVNLDNKLAELELEQSLFGLSEDKKEQIRALADLENQRKEAIAEITALQLDKNPEENLRLQGEEISNINALYDEMIIKIDEASQANYNSSREFMTGFSEAFQNFRTEVEDSAAYGKNLFDTMANGWTDALLNFAETGKLSFKDLFRSLMSEIVKMQANKLFLSLFGGGGVFGSFFSNIFGGARANGGPVSAGKSYLIGEKGPEMFVPNSSGTVVPNNVLGGATQVTYNINAVDALSFKQLVAADPQFIYNVSRMGSRRYS